MVQYSQMLVLKAKIFIHQLKPVSSLELLKTSFEIRKKDIKLNKDIITPLEYNNKLMLSNYILFIFFLYIILLYFFIFKSYIKLQKLVI